MEARDGSLWSGTVWGALRLSRGEATLYTAEETGAALRAPMPGLRLSIVPDGAAPARPWPEGIGAAPVGGVHRALGSSPVVIYALASGGPAEAAGLKVGDRIAAVNGDSRVNPSWLNGPAGTSVKLTVQREGRLEPFEVTVVRRKVAGTHRDFGVRDVYEDRDGAVWFALFAEVLRYTPLTQGSQWRLYTEADGLDFGVAGHRTEILQTRDGSIWAVSTHGYKGVNRFEGTKWTNFLLSDTGGDNHDASILETGDGTLWIGGGFGVLHAYREGAWTVYRAPGVPVPGNRVIGLLEASDGALWVAGLGQEAARLDFGTWTTYRGLNFQCETPDGAFWFVSWDSSVVRYDGQGWTRYGVEDRLMDIPLALIATTRTRRLRR